MKKNLTFILILTLFISNRLANANSENTAGGNLPKSVLKQIAKQNNLKIRDIHTYPKGILKIEGGYIAAVIYAGPVKSCAIYVSLNDKLLQIFNGAPCEFATTPKSTFLRKKNKPDILYPIKLFSPNRGAMTDEMVALYFEMKEGSYCESKNLAGWYQTGNKNISPNISDGICRIDD